MWNFEEREKKHNLIDFQTVGEILFYSNRHRHHDNWIWKSFHIFFSPWSVFFHFNPIHCAFRTSQQGGLKNGNIPEKKITKKIWTNIINVIIVILSNALSAHILCVCVWFFVCFVYDFMPYLSLGCQQVFFSRVWKLPRHLFTLNIYPFSFCLFLPK